MTLRGWCFFFSLLALLAGAVALGSGELLASVVHRIHEALYG